MIIIFFPAGGNFRQAEDFRKVCHVGVSALRKMPCRDCTFCDVLRCLHGEMVPLAVKWWIAVQDRMQSLIMRLVVSPRSSANPCGAQRRGVDAVGIWAASGYVICHVNLDSTSRKIVVSHRKWNRQGKSAAVKRFEDRLPLKMSHRLRFHAT